MFMAETIRTVVNDIEWCSRNNRPNRIMVGFALRRFYSEAIHSAYFYFLRVTIISTSYPFFLASAISCFSVTLGTDFSNALTPGRLMCAIETESTLYLVPLPDK